MAKMIGPVTFSMKVHFGNQQEQLIGSVNCDLAAGRVPDEKAVMEMIGEALNALPDDKDLELLSPSDFFNNVIIKEKFGRKGNFAVPNDFTYDVKQLTEVANAAHAMKPKKSRSDEEE